MHTDTVLGVPTWHALPPTDNIIMHQSSFHLYILKISGTLIIFDNVQSSQQPYVLQQCPDQTLTLSHLVLQHVALPYTHTHI